MVRPGFTLVEVAVALGLIALAALTAGAAATLSAGALARAEAREAATAAAELVLDSLAQEVDPRPGSRVVDGVPVEWSVTGGGTVRVCDLRVGGTGEALAFRVYLAPAPAALGAGP
ncbi:MAG: prepilin-type N-terminal cleavage/methylation domain-containing protein [Gemmatimonadetes bacterium]|nr:prepilin-type N-terminal cleavage/methylation domain-containing protein [Gemmatimonadota bacterium]